MIVQNHRAMAAFAVIVGLMAALAAAVGVFARGDGSYEIVTSVRGVTYAMATTGVYAYNAQRVVSEGVGWDVFTLLVAVPTMLAAAGFVAGGSFRGRLLALGLFTRIVAFICSGEMAVAYFMMHAPGGFWPALNQGDAAILFCFVFFYLAFAGPGDWSFDALRGQSGRRL